MLPKLFSEMIFRLKLELNQNASSGKFKCPSESEYSDHVHADASMNTTEAIENLCDTPGAAPVGWFWV